VIIFSFKPSGATGNDVAGQNRPAGLAFDTRVLEEQHVNAFGFKEVKKSRTCGSSSLIERFKVTTHPHCCIVGCVVDGLWQGRSGIKISDAWWSAPCPNIEEPPPKKLYSCIPAAVCSTMLSSCWAERTRWFCWPRSREPGRRCRRRRDRYGKMDGARR